MEEKYVICYYAEKNESIYIDGEWRTIGFGTEVIHESIPLTNYPLTADWIKFHEPDQSYLYAIVEKRFYPRKEE
jgi:hypothetical protein